MQLDREKVWHPYIVRPHEDRWNVIFVSDLYSPQAPFVYRSYPTEAEARAAGRALNRQFWAAFTESRELLNRAQSAARPASDARASWWTRLKALLRPR